MKVLLVEDDPAMARMCAKLLRRRGHFVLVACSSENALRIISDTNDIDVVVSDVQMPEMNGIQLLARLHTLKDTLPVILMTGYGNLVNSAQALAMGAVACIVKPFEPDVFIACLERASISRHKAAAS